MIDTLLRINMYQILMELISIKSYYLAFKSFILFGENLNHWSTNLNIWIDLDGIFICTLFIITILLIFIFRRVLLRNKHLKEINLQRENLTKAIVQVQVNEQTKIAKELHDCVGTYLSTLKINLQLYESILPPNKLHDFLNSLKLIDKISNELRNIMRNLSNETLNELGLDVALKDSIQVVNELGITHIDFHKIGLNSRLNESVEHNLYRIAQELVTNCIKHAKATTATLQIIENDNDILLIFEDDGVGFDENKSKDTTIYSGMGLKNIRYRVQFLHGKIHIDSNPKNGSTFIIEIPKNITELETFKT